MIKSLDIYSSTEIGNCQSASEDQQIQLKAADHVH